MFGFYFDILVMVLVFVPTGVAITIGYWFLVRKQNIRVLVRRFLCIGVYPFVVMLVLTAYSGIYCHFHNNLNYAHFLNAAFSQLYPLHPLPDNMIPYVVSFSDNIAFLDGPKDPYFQLSTPLNITTRDTLHRQFEKNEIRSKVYRKVEPSVIYSETGDSLLVRIATLHKYAYDYRTSKFLFCLRDYDGVDYWVRREKVDPMCEELPYHEWSYAESKHRVDGTPMPIDCEYRLRMLDISQIRHRDYRWITMSGSKVHMLYTRLVSLIQLEMIGAYPYNTPWLIVWLIALVFGMLPVTICLYLKKRKQETHE